MKTICWAGLLLALTACASPKLATKEELDAEEQKIMAPFMESQTLVARSVQVRMTANFYDEFIATRVVKLAHKVERRARLDGGTNYRYTVIRREPVMMFLIGETQIAVEEELTLEVLGGTHALSLSVEAQAVTLARGSIQENLRSLKIENGSFTRDRGR